MRKVLEHCPNCGGDFEITRLNCTNCETVILSRYESCRFCKLPPESLKFLESFVKNRGNVKEMERELDISYWTIRSQLNDLIADLGFEEEAQSDTELKDQRREILEQVDQGELSATDAAELLSRLK